MPFDVTKAMMPDSISGRIAKQLYPKAKIQVTGFEKTQFPDGFFDLAVGNVPFGNYKVNDAGYNKENEAYSSGVRASCSSVYSFCQSGLVLSNASGMPPQPTYCDNTC